MISTTQNKTAILIGATGMVGGFVLKELISSESYSKVLAFTRKPLSISHPKLENLIIDFEKLPHYSHLISGDDLFLCLGTTMKKAGSKEAFKKVDFDYPYQIAKMAEMNGVKQLLLCSAVGANADSIFFYNQIKGCLENELKQMNFESIQIFQPSLLLGERQEKRTAEKLFIQLNRGLDGLIGRWLGKYRPIEAEKVAAAMIKNAQKKYQGVVTHTSDDMKKY